MDTTKAPRTEDNPDENNKGGEFSYRSKSVSPVSSSAVLRSFNIVSDHDDNEIPGVYFVDYTDERQLASVMDLVGRDLSEPYSTVVPKKKKKKNINEYHEDNTINDKNDEDNNNENATDDNDDDIEFEPIGCVVGKVDDEEVYIHGTTKIMSTGYIGMLAVNESYRRKGIGKALVKRVLYRMQSLGCTSVTLETEVSNVTAQKLYQNSFGFVREELLVRYYLNWGDAYRLRLWFS